MVEHGRAHSRLGIAQAEHGEAPDRPGTQSSQRFDLGLHDAGLVRLGGVPPRLEGRVPGRRDALVENPLLQAVVLGQSFPVEVRPAFGAHESRRSRHGLRPELADETDGGGPDGGGP